ncbi:hypothetical protein BDV18DRAFT_107788 [Aspergillus unguis]
MTDYSTLKVADLKAELKRRGIPQTGLRVKQQIIDKLVEEDNKEQTGDTEEAPTLAETEPKEQAQSAEPEAPAATEEEHDDEPTKETAPPTADEQEEIKAIDDRLAEGRPSQPEDSAEPQPQPTQSEEPSQKTRESEEKHSKTESTKPGEQSPGSRTEAKPSTTKDEATTTVAPGAQTSGVNTAVSTPLPTEELIEDVRKRKRRSRSPAPHLDEVARKKAKAADEADAEPSSEDRDTTSANLIEQAPKSSDISQSPPNKNSPTERADTVEVQTKKSTPQKQDVRFKSLLSSTGREQRQPSPPPVDTEMADTTIEPSVHAATSALYIDGLMRPLQPAALKNHLLLVASPSGASPNPDLIAEFYLDSIKTHCFAKFADVSTASRARSALHGTVWPNEKNRKSLFVDFIPEHKVHDWIQMEEAARGRRGPPPRWRVEYDNRDGEVVAVLEEVGLNDAGRSTTKEFSQPPPRGPKADMQPIDQRPSGSTPQRRSSHPGQGFKPLDELFKSTTAKPKLYYLPVPREVADKRLDRFDDLLREGSFPRRGGDETRKFSFENDDQFIDLGAEFAGRGRGGGRGRGRGGMMDSRRGRY